MAASMFGLGITSSGVLMQSINNRTLFEQKDLGRSFSTIANSSGVSLRIENILLYNKIGISKY
jgi:hypothetical protein